MDPRYTYYTSICYVRTIAPRSAEFVIYYTSICYVRTIAPRSVEFVI